MKNCFKYLKGRQSFVYLVILFSTVYLSAQEELGQWPGLRRGQVKQCAVDGSIAYLATGAGALVMVDVSEPSAPERMSSIAVQGSLSGVAVDGGIAYCAGSEGLSIVNVSDPATPVVIKKLALGNGRRVAVNGNILCFAGTQLHVVDITDPSDPVTRSSFETPDGVADVDLTGNHAIVVLGYQSSPEVIIQVIDLSNLDAPAMVWEHRREIFVGPYSGPQVHIDGSRAFIASVDEWWLLDISNPVQPAVVGRFPNGTVFDVCGSGDFAYVAIHSGGLAVWDLSNPTYPVSWARPTTYTCAGIVQGNHYFAADLYDGLHVIDVSNSSNAVEVGHYSDVGPTWDVAVAGSHAFVADGWSGLRVLDISDPTHIVECASHLLADATSIELVGDIAFVGGGRHAGLWVFDVSNPCHPKLLSKHTTYRFDVGNAVCISRGYAYIAKGYCSGWSGVRILDVRNPEDPQWVADYPTEGHAYDVSVEEGLMVVASDGELDVVDVGDPSNPVRLGQTSGGKDISRLCRDGRYVYCSAYLGPLSVVDLVDPSNPAIVATVPASGSTMDLFVRQSHLYRCRTFWGGGAIEVYDVSLPEQIEYVSEFASRYPTSVFANHDLLAITDLYDGATFSELPYGRSGLAMHVVPSATDTALNLCSTTPGMRYQVFSSNDLKSWIDRGIVEGNGHTVCKDVTDICNGEAQLFFRFADLGPVKGEAP